jgi:hypothetical protein
VSKRNSKPQVPNLLSTTYFNFFPGSENLRRSTKILPSDPVPAKKGRNDRRAIKILEKVILTN